MATAIDEGKEVLPNSLVTDNTGENNSHVTDNKNGAVEKLDPNDVSASIEALTTAISMKQIAISKESKKRDKVNNPTIAQWKKEIESLDRTIPYLKSI